MHVQTKEHLEMSLLWTEAWNKFFLQSSEGTNPANALGHISSLQNWKNMNFYCLMSLGLWYFIMAVPEN